MCSPRPIPAAIVADLLDLHPCHHRDTDARADIDWIRYAARLVQFIDADASGPGG
jgi:hypothetical protein